MDRSPGDDPAAPGRRRFCGKAVAAFAAAPLGLVSEAGIGSAPASGPLASGWGFGPLKQIDAGLLSVAYAEAGPADGPPVLLLHGWPYDIYSFGEVAPLLGARGFRVLAPYLRGYG